MSRRRDRESAAAIDATASDWILRRESGLSAEETSAYEAWLAADPCHADAVARFEQAWTLLDRPLAGGRAAEMVAALKTRAAARRHRRAAIAAAAALVLVSFGGFWRTSHRAGSGSSPVSAVVISPKLETLPDGTVVELKPGARIAVDFSGPFRRVTLRHGEALFRVAKNPNRPFVVTAGGVEVRAVGTVFAVRLADEGLEVVVTEGRVAVEKPEPRAAHENARAEATAAPVVFSTLAGAGERVSVDFVAGAAAPQAVTISPEDIAERLAWRATRIEFTDTPLAEAVELLNRHSKVRLIVDDPKLARVPVNGLFRADNTDALVRLLEGGFGVSAERAGETVTLRRKR